MSRIHWSYIDGIISTANVDMLKQIAPENWPELQFRLHSSVQRFQANFNSVEIWQSLQQELTPPAPEKTNITWLMWRNADHLTELMPEKDVSAAAVQ